MRYLVDTIHADVSNIPSSVPNVAGYTTGTPDIQWTASDWDKFKGSKVRIDQSGGLSPRSGDVKDVEPGASTIAEAVAWARNRKTLGLRSTIYLPQSLFAEAWREVHVAGLGDDVYYWVADWSWSEETAQRVIDGNPKIVAVQFASPGSNPYTVIPGTHITLSQANADLSVMVDWWMPGPRRRRRIHRLPPVHRKVKGSTGGAALGVALSALLRAVGVHIDPELVGAISTLSAAIGGYLTPGHKVR